MKKRSRKLSHIVITIFVCAIMMAGVLPMGVLATDTPVTPPVTTPDKDAAGHADLRVDVVETQFLTQGVTNTFVFTVKNRAWNTAKNVRITASGEGDLAAKFSIVEGTNAYVARDYMYSKTSISTKLKIDASVPDGVYKLNLKFEYKTTDGVDSPAVTEQVYIYVNGSNDARPFVKSVQFDKEEIGKDNKVKMTVNVENPTPNRFEGVKLELKTGETKDFTLYENFQPAYITAIEPNSTATAEFSVYVGAAVATGNYPLAFNLTFRDSEYVIHSYMCPVYAQIKRTADAEGGDDDKTSTPRIIVNKYSTDVEEIKAGKSFKLDFTLENTSTINVSNMKVTVGSAAVAGTGAGGSGAGGGTASGNVFFPVAGSNSFFINSLAAKGTVSQNIELMAKQDVEPGVYQVVLTIDYEDNTAKQFKSEENIAFNVTQEQRLEMVGFVPPMSGGAKEPMPVTFQYINKGKSTIYNLSVSADGDFTLEGGDLYIGNLTAGFNDFFDGSIIADSEGKKKGAVILKFEDSQGNSKEIRNDVEIEIMAGGGMDMGGGMIGGGDTIGGGMMPALPEGMEIDPETGELVPIKTGLAWWIYAIIGAVVLAGGAVAFLLIMKKRKAKKELIADEED